MAAASAAAAAAFGYSQLTSPSYADAVDDAASNSSSSGATQASKQSAFVDWLTSHGADASAVALKTSEVSPCLSTSQPADVSTSWYELHNFLHLLYQAYIRVFSC
jgi:hypothetical protein